MAVFTGSASRSIARKREVSRSVVTPMRTAKVLRIAWTHLDMLLEPPGEATLSEMDW